MSQMLDLDDFPIGTLARTPSGRIGIVIKHKGAASKQDHFQRLVLHFSSDPHDSVTLQPNMLEPLTPRTSGRALTATAREFWASEHGETLMQKMRNRQEFTQADRDTLERVMSGEPCRPCAVSIPATV